jgi:protein-disulfide isomerase
LLNPRRDFVFPGPRPLLAALALLLLGFCAAAQTPPPAADPSLAARLLAPGPLPDIVQGSPDAPATIIEYGSLTCSHCAAFHRDVWPRLKARYIDAGRAKFIFREFPLDPLSAAAFLLTRCPGAPPRGSLIDRLFDEQASWAFVDKPGSALKALMLDAGMSEATFERCIRDAALYRSVLQTRARAERLFSVKATPTFFVNGVMLTGERSLEDFERALSASMP